MPGGAIGATIIVMLIMFVLGFILDTFEIIFIVIPITAPVLLTLGVDPIWLGVAGRREPADQLPDPALRLLAVLPARRRAAAGDHRHDLPGRHPLRRPAGRRPSPLLFLFPELATWLPRLLYH